MIRTSEHNSFDTYKGELERATILKNNNTPYKEELERAMMFITEHNIFDSYRRELKRAMILTITTHL